MKANCWHGKKDVRVENVPDPKILNQRDCIAKITSTAILRLRPSPLQRFRTDAGERRHSRT